MRSTYILSFLAIVVPALGAPTLVPITKRAGPYEPDSYILMFKHGASKAQALETLKQKFAEPDSRSSVTYDYGNFFHGAAVHVPAGSNTLTFIRSMNEIESVEQDLIASLDVDVPTTGHDEPLASTQGMNTRPWFERAEYGDGAGVVVYGVDTASHGGINVDHECFGGRASWGLAVGEFKQHDGNGHGTHTAGTAVGHTYGIATSANMIAVKVLSDEGSGPYSGIIDAIRWIVEHARGHGKPSIVNMSLGGPVYPALDEAVRNAIGEGVHFTVSAGNSGVSAENASPARVEQANTVGAVDQDDNRAKFSNYGPLVDVWALGVNVRSAWIDNSTSTRVLSGTSMSAPRVAGILAVAISKHGQRPPADLSADLVENAKQVHRVINGTETTDYIAQSW